MNRVAIAIITWNNADDAIECAESLRAQSIFDEITVVFIDNNSKPETITKLKKFLTTKSSEHFSLIETGYNGGTAGGFNAAVEWATMHGINFVGALNADAVADKNWCEALVTELDNHPETGIVTGTVLHRDGQTIDSTGDFYTTWGLASPRHRDLPASAAPASPGVVFGATGGCFVARTAMYETVGKYDEKMFMYYEDVDLSFRAQLMNFTVRYTPRGVVYHKRGASADTVPGLATYNTFKNLPVLFTKNVPFSLWPHIYPRFMLAYTLILLSAIKTGRGIPALKGWLMSWAYVPYMFGERFRIQKRRITSDSYIKGILFQGIPPDQSGLLKFRNFFRWKKS